ncbi:TnpV protein [Fusobacterium sp. CM1]|uniref:TnpV protein n=2 Tax=Fusobacteriaceae TaxID=203492 RepID=UPI00350FA5AF
MRMKKVVLEEREFYQEIIEGKEVYTAISPMNFYERQGGKYTIETLDGQKILLPEGIEVIDLDKILEVEEIKYWGRERVRYLEEEKPQLLKELMTTKELIPHLIAIQEEVKKFIEIEKPKMMKSWGITEEHQSLMNNFQSSLKEIIYQEIIQR